MGHLSLPWQEEQWRLLLVRKKINRLPHALLLEGQIGLGKFNFALALAELLLCEQNDKTACGKCRACHLLNIGNHPDLIMLGPEETSKTIKIHQIRELVNTLNQTAQFAGYQIVIINPAETMNRAAANALLKMLEEPPGQVMILLLTHQPALLPATIRSRCQRVIFSPPSLAQGKQWLSKHLGDHCNNLEVLLTITENAPLSALKMFENGEFETCYQLLTDLVQLSHEEIDPIQCATHYKEADLQKVLSYLHIWIMLAIRYSFSIQLSSEWSHQQLSLLEIISQKTAHLLFAYLDNLQQAKRQLQIVPGLNQQLLLESFFISWADHSGALEQ